MFLKGEMITVTRKISDAIWEGECEGITGTFPAKLVKPAGSSEGQTQGPTTREPHSVAPSPCHLSSITP